MVGCSTVGYARGRWVRALRLLETESDASLRVRSADLFGDGQVD